MSKNQYVMKLFEDPQHEEFRVFDRNGEPWFVLNEVCKKLGISNPRNQASRLDDDEKDSVQSMDAIGRSRPTTIISESGLYSVIFSSNKPEAKAFKKWITSEVLPSIRKTGGYRGKTPAFIQRANKNWDKVDEGYFSVINELAVLVWGRLEREGHIMADRGPDGKEIRPDVSVGRAFSDWLKKCHPALAKNYKFYPHEIDGKVIEARQYPYDMLPLFRVFVETVWWPERFESYIKLRDPAALQYLPKLLPPTSQARI